MKKTLFLSAILGAALCSSAFGAASVVADYTTTDSGITYSGAIVEYLGSSTGQNIGTSGVTFKIHKDGAESITCPGADTQPAVLGGTSSKLWEYLSSADQNTVYGQTLKMSGSEGGNVKLIANFTPRFGGLITTITSTAEGAQNGTYTLNGGSHDLFFEGNTQAGVNMSIGANTTIEVAYTNTIETRTSGTWNIAEGKTLTLQGGRVFVKANQTITLAGGGEVKIAITNNDRKIELESGAKIDLKNGTTLELRGDGINCAFNTATGTGITTSDDSGKLLLTASTIEYNQQTGGDGMELFTGDVVVSGSTLQVGTKTTRFANAKSFTISNNGIIKGHTATFTRDLVLDNGGVGDAGADETFSGAITLKGDSSYASASSGNTVTLNGTISGGGSFTKKGAGSVTFSGNNAQVIKNLTVAEGTANVENANLTLTGFINAKGTLNVKSDLSTPDYMGMGDNASVVVSNGAKLTVADASTGKGIWINAGASLTLQGTSSLSIADDTITITGAGAKVTRHDNNATAKLGLLDNNDQKFTKNVKVTNGNVVYSGSGTLYLGSMQGGSLTSTGDIEFAGADSTIGSLTLSGNTITLGTAAAHDNDLTITTTLAVTANSTMNANLIVNNGATMDFSKHTELTMGCTVTIGNNVTIKIDDSELASIVNTGSVMTIINNVGGVDMEHLELTLGSGWKFVDAQGNSLDAYNLRLDVVEARDGKVNIVVAPEPATATLSLLALAALAARRRRH